MRAIKVGKMWLHTHTDFLVVYKTLNGPAPPVLSGFVKKADGRNTSAVDRGDCIIQCSKSMFGIITFLSGISQLEFTSG